MTLCSLLARSANATISSPLDESWWWSVTESYGSDVAYPFAACIINPMPECMRVTLLVSYKSKNVPRRTGPRRGSNHLPFQQEKVVIGKVVSSSGGGVEISRTPYNGNRLQQPQGHPYSMKFWIRRFAFFLQNQNKSRIATRVQWSQNDGATPKLRDCKATLFTISWLWSYREGRSSKQGWDMTHLSFISKWEKCHTNFEETNWASWNEPNEFISELWVIIIWVASLTNIPCY